MEKSNKAELSSFNNLSFPELPSATLYASVI